MKTKIRKNINTISLFYFLKNFSPILVILWVYLTEKLGSATLSMSCLSLTYVFSSLSEVPTGILSDLVGRRVTMILGSICKLLSSLVLILAHPMENAYFMYVIFAVLVGLSLSFYSGTDKALIYETLRDLKKKHKFHNAYSKYMSIKRIALSLGALIGGLLASMSYVYTFYLYFVVMIAMTIVTLFFIEPKSLEIDNKSNKDKKSKKGLKHFFDALKNMKKNRKLRYLAIGYAIEASLSRVSVEFRQVFLKTIVPLWVIGLARSLKSFVGAVSYWVSGRIIDKFGYYKSLIGVGILYKIITIFAILMANILTPFVFVITAFLRAPYEVSFASLTQREFSSSQRATMDSVISMVKDFLAALLTFLVGLVSDLISPQFAIIAMMVLSFTSLIFYKKVFREEG